MARSPRVKIGHEVEKMTVEKGMPMSSKNKGP